jgi:hypothetical protein
MFGNGTPALIGPKSIKALLTSSKFMETHRATVSGNARSLNDHFPIDIKNQKLRTFHIGNTNVNYSISCTNKCCKVKYNLFKGDGFWGPKEKTKIVNIGQGFDFLGQNVRKYNGKLLIKPSKDSVSSIRSKIKEIVKANKSSKTISLIRELNPVIRGWCNYHRHIVAKETFTKLDNYIFHTLWKWAVRRHANKNRRWIKDKYFQSHHLRNWVFTAYDENGKAVRLISASKTKIVRHVKIKSEANPYLSIWNEYFEKRKQKNNCRVSSESRIPY